MEEQTQDTRYVPKLAMALVHYPILDKSKKIVATNITNFDIHDIARAAKVYGVDRYYIVHPMQEQLMFVHRILDHWRTGEGSKFNQYRKRALTDVHTAESIDQAIADWGGDCITIATHARPVPGVKTYSFQELKELAHTPGKRVFLIFGTGFGLTEPFMQSCDGVLESIRGAPPLDFRHLSVRSAVSICLDRIMGPW